MPPIQSIRRFFAISRARAIVAGFALLGVIGALAVADVANPPDLSRVRMLSPEVVDHDGVLLRPFLSKDGYWRLRTTVRDVNPRYLMLLKAYEDKRYDTHWGVDPMAMVRAVLQLAHARRVVSGGSTLTMQAARLLEPRPRGFGHQDFPDDTRAAIGRALFQGRNPFDLSDVGPVRRQSRRRARGVARLFRQAALGARSVGGSAPRRPAAIAGAAQARPSRHRRDRRAQQSAGSHGRRTCGDGRRRGRGARRRRRLA